MTLQSVADAIDHSLEGRGEPYKTPWLIDAQKQKATKVLSFSGGSHGFRANLMLSTFGANTQLEVMAESYTYGEVGKIITASLKELSGGKAYCPNLGL